MRYSIILVVVLTITLSFVLIVPVNAHEDCELQLSTTIAFVSLLEEELDAPAILWWNMRNGESLRWTMLIFEASPEQVPVSYNTTYLASSRLWDNQWESVHLDFAGDVYAGAYFTVEDCEKTYTVVFLPEYIWRLIAADIEFPFQFVENIDLHR